VGELRKRFGLRGAEAFVRRYGLEAVNRAVADYDRVGEEGAEIRSPAGFIVWLVKEGAADGRG